MTLFQHSLIPTHSLLCDLSNPNFARYHFLGKRGCCWEIHTFIIFELALILWYSYVKGPYSAIRWFGVIKFLSLFYSFLRYFLIVIFVNIIEKTFFFMYASMHVFFYTPTPVFWDDINDCANRSLFFSSAALFIYIYLCVSL